MTDIDLSHKKSNGAVDPTVNVQALSESSNKRQDDLRRAEKELFATNVAYIKEIADIRENHRKEKDTLVASFNKEIKAAEAGRLDSIRQVDREDVAKTAASAQLATAALDATTKQLAATLQQQVGQVAVAAEQRQSASYSELTKRLSAVELALSEGKGKQAVSDPASERLAIAVEGLIKANAIGSGKSLGAGSLIAYIFGGAGFLAAIVSIVVMLVRMKP